MPHKPEQRDAQNHRRPANPGCAEPIVLLPLVQNHLQAACPKAQQAKAKIVERARLRCANVLRIAHIPVNHEDREHADRDIDVERIAPAIRVGQPAAKRWPQHRRDDHAESEQRHRRTALGRRKTLQQDRLREWLQRSTARSLQHARNQQHGQRRRGSTEERRNGEQHHARHQKPLAPEAQREPVARRKNDGVGDQVAGQHPGRFGVRRGERPCDIRQRHRGDGRVQHLHEGGQHHRDRDDPWVRNRRCGECVGRAYGDLRGCGHACPDLVQRLYRLGPERHVRSARRHAE